MQQIPLFKIRCSKIADIMTDPKKGTLGLSKTAKAYLVEWLKSKLYGVKKQISSKYLDKGIMVESDAIEYASEHLGWFMAQKNTQFFEDDFFTGTPDVLLPDMVADIKSSWDVFTFPLLDEIAPDDYEPQLQGYMHLTGRKRAQLVYVLMDTPDEIYGAHSCAIPENLEQLDAKYRIKVFEYEYNPDYIEQVQERVLMCREWLNGFNLVG